jgi:hypothetical protein
MSTEQMRFAKRIMTAKQACLAVSDALIVQGFLPYSAKILAPEQFKNAEKVLLLLRF